MTNGLKQAKQEAFMRLRPGPVLTNVSQLKNTDLGTGQNNFNQLTSGPHLRDLIDWTFIVLRKS